MTLMTVNTHISNLHYHNAFNRVKLSIRNYLDTKGYLQLDLPALSPSLIPESYLEVFETEYRYFNKRQKLYLTPSPELFIKRLLVEGIGDCYYMGKSFRNSEPTSSRHLGEFTMLEMYRVNADYMDIADEVLSLLQYVNKHMGNKNNIITYQDKQIDLSKWEKLSVADAFAKYASIDADILFDHAAFAAKARAKGYAVKDAQGNSFTYEELWSQTYATAIEPHLGMHGYPTILYDYPVEFAALSQPNTDGRTAQRFECYIAGLELGNCYSELADWSLQESRLRNELKQREESGKIDHPADWGFVESLKKGLPRCAGIAIGVERLAMIFADVDSIDKLHLISIR